MDIENYNIRDLFYHAFRVLDENGNNALRVNFQDGRTLYIKGDSGSSGTSGISLRGTSGTSGRNGYDGFDGTSGTNGRSGTSGTSGINVKGKDGSSGTSGRYEIIERLKYDEFSFDLDLYNSIETFIIDLYPFNFYNLNKIVLQSDDICEVHLLLDNILLEKYNVDRNINIFDSNKYVNSMFSLKVIKNNSNKLIGKIRIKYE